MNVEQHNAFDEVNFGKRVCTSAGILVQYTVYLHTPGYTVHAERPGERGQRYIWLTK